MNLLPLLIIVIIFIIISLYLSKTNKKNKKCGVHVALKKFLNMQKDYIKSKKNDDSDLESSDSDDDLD